MKRIACLMLVLSIACAGCQVMEPEVTKTLLNRIDELEIALGSQHTELKGDIKKLEEELSQIKIGLKALRDKIIELETALESLKKELIADIAKLEEELSQIKEALLARTNKLETALETKIAQLRADITKLEEELSQIKEVLLARIDNLETALESQIAELRADITKLEERLPKPDGIPVGVWFTSAAIATIISALIVGGVAVHRSRKDTKIQNLNRNPQSDTQQSPRKSDEAKTKAILLDLSNKKPGSMFELEFSGLGLLGHWLSCILGKRFPIEVRSDWLRVSEMHCRIVERIFSEAKDKPIPPEKLSLLFESRNCLCAAKITHVLEAAWRYVNQASETLSNINIAEEKECAELAERFLEWEPSLNENLKDIFKESLVEKLEKLEKNRKDAKEDCAKMIRTHSRQWALINQANLFRICITRNVTFVFLVSLTIMLLATKFVITGKLSDGSIHSPYLYIAIYGWFGAALSILLGVRKLRPSAVTFRTLWFSLLLRLALGAGGAFVTYVVVRTTGILSTSLLDSIPGFIALGIAGGFSERLFQNVLDMFVKQIVPSKYDEGSEKVD